MKLTSDTVELLKNFSTINPGIYFKKGKQLSTISPNKNILAEADIEEDISKDFGIYDLNNLLQIISLDKNGVELDLGKTDIDIKLLEGRSKVKYRFTSKEMIVTPPDKKLTLPSKDVEFDFELNDFQWVMKTSSVLQSPNICIESNGKDVFVTSFDASDDSKPTNSLKVGESNDKYRMTFKTENLKMLPGNYEVSISKKGIAEFKSKDRVLKYWVSLETKESHFE